MWEKGVREQTGTLIECWHGSSGHRNQTRMGLLIGRRDAILRDTSQLRSLISPAADPSPGRRFGFYRRVTGRPLACNGLIIRCGMALAMVLPAMLQNRSRVD